MAQGAAYATYVGSWRSRFRILHGAQHISRYEDVEAGTTRSFCARCGSPLTYRNDKKPDRIDIMTCSLDDPNKAPPTFHVWTDHKPVWDAIADGLPVFAKTKTET